MFLSVRAAVVGRGVMQRGVVLTAGMKGTGARWLARDLVTGARSRAATPGDAVALLMRSSMRRKRWLSTESGSNAQSQGQQAASNSRTTAISQFVDAEAAAAEQPLSKTQTAVWGGALILAGVCAYLFLQEVTGLSPTAVSNAAADKLRESDAVMAIVGEGAKSYGKDYGGQREGRRNLVENREYVHELAGDKRMRVRFNFKGSKGHVEVYAEMIKGGEWAYIQAKDTRTGRAISVLDNRTQTDHPKGTSQEKKDALTQLLTGGSSTMSEIGSGAAARASGSLGNTSDEDESGAFGSSSGSGGSLNSGGSRMF